MTTPDLEPAAQQMAHLIRAISPDQLQAPTPCEMYSLGDLLDHVGGLTLAFTLAARKDLESAGSSGPSGDASRLGDDWQSRIPADLPELVTAWRDPSAWTGMTRAGGIDLPGEVAGIVALNELVLHGWDVAKASAQVYVCDTPTLEVCHDFVMQFADADRGDAFSPVVAVPPDAPLIDRLVGLSGRDPQWSSP
jgi:uncharacterized protein (TIGR03086 family)